MNIGRLFPDLLATLGRAASPEAGFTRSLKRLVSLSGATAGAIYFRIPGGTPILVTAGARRGSELDEWLRRLLPESARAPRVGPLRHAPPGWTGRQKPVLVRTPLGERQRPVGQLLLLGRTGPRFRAQTIPPSFPREFGLAMEQVWGLHQRTLRLTVINEVTALMATTQALERIYGAAARAIGRLIRFDGFGVTLLDRERSELRVVELRSAGAAARVEALRLPAAGTLAEMVAGDGVARRVDDVSDGSVPSVARQVLIDRGFRSIILAPLVAPRGIIGAVALAHRAPRAFSDADVDVLCEVARPLASAIEQSRLHAETAQRAEALAALNRTSQLITSQLDLQSVLGAISRSVSDLLGSTGCGIGLLSPDRTAIYHLAADGAETARWPSLSIPIGQGIIGEVAATGTPIRVGDAPADPTVTLQGGDNPDSIRSLLAVPLRVAGEIIGVIAAYSTSPGFFTAQHQTLLEGFAEQAGIAIHKARLFEESQRRGRETQALLEAGRAVNQSLDVGETIRLILLQAREVLGVQSCGLFTLDAETGELSSVASLDLEPEAARRIRIRVGEGVTGLAVAERRAVQSPDVTADPRIRYPQLTLGSGLRSMLAAPLVVGDRAIGALTILREDVHRFTPEEESLACAFADQAAMALEHARLFSSVRTYSEQLEAMVAVRTRELDEQKRFVEVVLETLPVGLYVLDPELCVVSANREGARLLPQGSGARQPILELVPASRAGSLQALLTDAVAAQQVRQLEEELPVGGQFRVLRLTAAPLAASEKTASYSILLVEDITLKKRLERQMLLTERLTTAGRLAAGVAHELNNPLATIAGCAEALRERARDQPLAGLDSFKDFPSYLALIEEEAYRCKEITGSLLQFVREPGSRRAPTDVNAQVEKALDLLRHQPRFAESSFVVDLDPSIPPLVASEGQLRQVFLGLSSNGLEAMDGRGTLTVRTRLRPEDEIEVEFVDAGPGIAEDVLPRIFDPFFTTKPPGQGTGLGLAIAQGIIADHGGRIEVASRRGAGASFRVLLPLRPGGPPA